MKLNKRSYPYPVVGNSDDVPGAAFQATVEMTADKENIYLDVKINCSSATINEAIAEGAAKYVLHVECSNTLFRKAYDFSTPQMRIAIPADNLNDVVEANVFVRAVQSISSYKVDQAHPDYTEASFEIGIGEILAVGEGHIFHIESQFDSLSRIGSIMQVQEGEDGNLPMKIECNGDKIIIILSKQDFRDYKLLKSHELGIDPLTTAIVLPVLIEVLRFLEEDDGDGEDDGRRWVRVLTRRIKEYGLENESDRLVRAQKLLELPIRRALAAARTFAETSG